MSRRAVTAAAADVDEAEAVAEAWRTVKVRASAYRKLRDLLDRTSVGGWLALGFERKDLPSLGGILDELVSAAHAKLASTGRRLR